MTKSYLSILVALALCLLSRAQSQGNPYNTEDSDVIPPYVNEESTVEVTPIGSYEETVVIPPYVNEEAVVIPPYVNEEVVIIPIYNNEEHIVLPYNTEEVVIPPYVNNEETVVITPPYNNEETVVTPPYNNEETVVTPPYTNEETTTIEEPLTPYNNEEEQELFETSPPLPGATFVQVSGDKYACPDGYTYLSYEDANNYNSETCADYGASSTNRLLGGGSATGSKKGCQTKENDPRLFLKAVCVKTQIEEIHGCEGACPAGTATASLEEVQAYTNLFCSALGSWDIARIAFMGSMDGSGYDCKSRDWDPRSLGPTLCVKRKILDVKLEDSCENVCGDQSLTLLTVEEALASQEYYCSLLAPDAIVRLAGGGSMDGSEYGCHIRDTDRRRLGNGLCATKRT